MGSCEVQLCAATPPARRFFSAVWRDAVTSVSLVLANLATPVRVWCAFTLGAR